MSSKSVSRFGVEVDLSYEHKTGCPWHKNVKQVDYSSDTNVLGWYRAPKNVNSTYELWWLDVSCYDCRKTVSILEVKYKKSTYPLKCESCKRKKNILGQKYGKLTVVDFDRNEGGRNYWKYICECGNVGIKESRLFPSAKSCGCLSIESRLTSDEVRTHGMSDAKIYKVWAGMVERSTNEGSNRAEDYVLRGIGISDDWLIFENFYRDMGEPPSPEYSLDRVNNNLGYSKENCKWSTRSNQQSNRRVSNNTSGRIGVYFCKNTGKWSVKLSCDKINIWLGRHGSFKEACAVIEDAELKYLGYSRKEGFIK